MRASCGRNDSGSCSAGCVSAVDAVLGVARAQPGGDLVQVARLGGLGAQHVDHLGRRRHRPARAAGRCAARRTAPGSRRRRRALRRACCRPAAETALLQVGLRQDLAARVLDRLHHLRVAVELGGERLLHQQLAVDHLLQRLRRRCRRRRRCAPGGPRSRCRSPWRRAARRAGRRRRVRSRPAAAPAARRAGCVSSKRVHQAPVRDPAGERQAGEQQQPLVGLRHRGDREARLGGAAPAPWRRGSAPRARLGAGAPAIAPPP